MRMRRLTGLLVVVLVVGACSPGSPAVGNGNEANAESLADFFGYGGDPADQQARFQEQEAKLQETIRACMVDQGFEYIPVDYGEEVFFEFDEQSEEERVREQGFGITTYFGNEEEFFLEGPPEEQIFVDPNDEIVQAMSESEQQAYYEALHGNFEDEELTIDPDTGEEYYEGFGGGCYGQASEEIYGGGADVEALFQEIEPQMEEMGARVQADPRMVELNQKWAACMSDRGYEFQDQVEMYTTVFEDFQKRLDAIVGPGGGYADPFDGWTEEEINRFFEEKSEEEIEAFFVEFEQPVSDYDEAALAALQQEEIDLAVADFECRGDFMETMLEIQREYEADFIAANRETLEKIRDAQGG